MRLVPPVYQGLTVGFVLGFLTYHFFRRIRSIKSDTWLSTKYVMVIRTDINYGKAQTAEYCSQVTLENYRRALKATPDYVKSWERNRQPKITLKLEKDFEKEAVILKEKAESLGLVAVALKQNGVTAVVGIGPGPEESINEVTGHLKLLG